jgi:preprotein translocase subunit SecG
MGSRSPTEDRVGKALNRLFWLLLTVFVVIVVLVYLASQTLMGQEGG